MERLVRKEGSWKEGIETAGGGRYCLVMLMADCLIMSNGLAIWFQVLDKAMPLNLPPTHN